MNNSEKCLLSGNSIIDTARWLYKNGMIPLPICKGKKYPSENGWESRLPKECKANFEKYLSYFKSDSGIGLLCGEDSGVTVVDIDKKNEEGCVNGYEYWAELLKNNKEPKTLTQRTGGGGLHYIFKYMGNNYKSNTRIVTCSKTGKDVSIDLRTKGGLIVFAGTTHASGNKYKIINGIENNKPIISECPEWLRKIILDSDGLASRRIERSLAKREEKSIKNLTTEPVSKQKRNNAITDYNEICDNEDKLILDYVAKYFEKNILNNTKFSNHFSFRHKNGNIYNFNLTEPVNCPMCERVHDRENWLFVTVFEACVYANCRIADDKIYLGKYKECIDVMDCIKNGEHGLAVLLVDVLGDGFFGSNSSGKSGYYWNEKKLIWEIIYPIGLSNIIPTKLKPIINTQIDKLVQKISRELDCSTNIPALKALISMCKSSINSCNRLSSGISIARKAMLMRVDLARVDNLDSDVNILPIGNGQVMDFNDESKVVIRDRTMADNFTYACPVTYDATADQGDVKQFMTDIMTNNIENYKFLQKVLGYILLGTNAERKMILLHGAGKNGKSVLINILNNLFEPIYCQAEASVMIKKKNSSAASPEIAELRSKRLVIVTETEDGEKLNENVIKRMTGNDKLKGRFNFSDFITFTPMFVPVMMTNNLPDLSSDAAIWDRMLLIPFNSRFEGPTTIIEDGIYKENFNILEKMTSDKNKSALLSWLIEGINIYRRTNLTPPAEVLEVNEEYQTDQNTVGQFITDRCILNSEYYISLKDFKREYELYCCQMSIEQSAIKNDRAIGKYLSTKFKKFKNNVTCYKGLQMELKKE